VEKDRSLIEKVVRIFSFLDYFQTEKFVDSVHEPWTVTRGLVHHGPPMTSHP
jgi:hypothetical protein